MTKLLEQFLDTNFCFKCTVNLTPCDLWPWFPWQSHILIVEVLIQLWSFHVNSMLSDKITRCKILAEHKIASVCHGFPTYNDMRLLKCHEAPFSYKITPYHGSNRLSYCDIKVMVQTLMISAKLLPPLKKRVNTQKQDSHAIYTCSIGRKKVDISRVSCWRFAWGHR